MNDAADEAVRAPKPDRQTAAHYVYSPDVDPDVGGLRRRAPATTGAPDTMVAAINRTLKDELASQRARSSSLAKTLPTRRTPDNLSEVTGKGGVFKATLGLQRAFGSDRVFNSPIAEAAIVGRACGHGARAA